MQCILTCERAPRLTGIFMAMTNKGIFSVVHLCLGFCYVQMGSMRSNGSMKFAVNCYEIILQSHCNIKLYRFNAFKWFNWDTASKVNAIYLNHLNSLDNYFRMLKYFMLLCIESRSPLKLLNDRNHS